MSVNLKDLIEKNPSMKTHILDKTKEADLLTFIKKVNSLNNKIIKRGKCATEKHLNSENSFEKTFLIIPISVSPFDLVSHLFSLAESKNVKYLFVTDNSVEIYKKISKKESLSSCMLIDLNEKVFTENESTKCIIEDLFKEIDKLIFNEN